MKNLGAGKLPPDMLKRLLEKHIPKLYKSNPDLARRVIVQPAPGEDAAVIMGPAEPGRIVVTSDPITFIAEDLGWYAVHINANDIAAMGGEPEFLVLVVLMPAEDADIGGVARILSDATEACAELGVLLIGGHTEITPAVRRPIAVGHMLGSVPHDRILSSANARAGEEILLTKGYPVEGIAVMAAMARDKVLTSFGREFHERCRGFVKDPGISVVPDSRALRLAAGGLNAKLGALHDPTEGGLATGLREVAEASGLGLMIEGDKLPLIPEGEALCRCLRLDPLGVIASGSLIATCDAGMGEAIAREVAGSGIPCEVIGRMTENSGQFILRTTSGTKPLPRFEVDEVTLLL
ncbi:MAG: hydrogenase expression protein [Candidatus Eisenbacteria bacterium]|uniref:Hydrogenase expression protein n=1 Tax=Eiseniibacteriota bacterium TaxID=2212470 RepID=A0A948W6Y6_UNCEI|nr:hydrogenase expression protein [Candidatus Eisenbacteria bacterium]MBU1949453.1 hydrogenase expression protein [Candidatus Eisenbacteria bacterium]MBU2691630.1 hydrogenase expression protein [Candidatus Eisenbacteria bacterium]